MTARDIVIRGAREHNLQGVDLTLPRESLVTFTGVSGSGKSSLAFDTLYQEGQRRFLESLSSYARQFVGRLEKPRVEAVEGLSPTVSIDQKTVHRTPRSTVGTVTEIYDFLRLLYARLGTAHCHRCGHELRAQTVDQIVATLLREEAGQRCQVLGPVVRGRKGQYRKDLEAWRHKGYVRARIDGELRRLDEPLTLERYQHHTIELVVDRIRLEEERRGRLAEAVETGLKLGDGLVSFLLGEQRVREFSSTHSCPTCHVGLPELEPRLFSFNSPHGACPECHGLGHERDLPDRDCRTCQGARLRPEALAVTFRDRPIQDLTARTVEEARALFGDLELRSGEERIGSGILRELRARLSFLDAVGLSYLTLDRSAATLSGGEAQRVRLATQVGSGLQGVLYVLDEPSIGLHARDQNRLLRTLRSLRDRHNTVVVVEHDRDTMLASDWLVDIGPGAGREGGRIVAQGPLHEVLEQSDSVTARYLRGTERMPEPARRRPVDGAWLRIEGASHFNLDDLDVDLPLGLLVGVTGVSGSGKSTLVDLVLHRELARRLHRAEALPGRHRRLVGVEQLDKVIEISQAPIGRTPRSNPATYTKVWSLIRDLFAATPEARLRGYGRSRFSFNVKGGRCESCQGAGVRTVEMQFLADVQVPCEECSGRRFHRETLEILYRGRSVHDVLELTVREALELFAAVPRVQQILQTLTDVGLDYVTLGQPSTTLSGGEAQRVKLAAELSRPATGRTLYILDEPTTGLHFSDIRRLVATLERLVERGNTVLVIEHNLDVIRACDWLIDLGPDGGAHGGRVVASGPPEELMRRPESATGRFLRRDRQRRLPGRQAPRRSPAGSGDTLSVRGARANNLAGIDVRLPHDRLTVITGVSGSGKTSLAFDTLFAEGQRRFVESLSTYARRFFSRLERAPLERVDGLRPAIAIDQRAASHNPRSTVATSTEIYDHLRLLFARVGTPHCPGCDRPLEAVTASRATAQLLELGQRERVWIAAPLYRRGGRRPLMLERPADLEAARSGLVADGFARLLVDGHEQRLDQTGPLAGARSRSIDLVVDRLRLEKRPRTRLAEAFEEAQRRGHGLAAAWLEGAAEPLEFSSRIACDRCGYFRAEPLTPRHFSFNHHLGACDACQGLGRSRRAVEEQVVPRPERPLLEGALAPEVSRHFQRRGSWLHGVLQAAAEHLGADLSQPFTLLTRSQRAGLLRGDGVPARLATRLARSRGRHREETLDARWRGILGEVESWCGRDGEGRSAAKHLVALTEEGACPECDGSRLQAEIRRVRVGGQAIHECTRLTVEEALPLLEGLELTAAQREIARQPLQEICSRLRFLRDVGLDYVTLDRPSRTLSGGESQRIRLAQQLGAALVGVLYVLDEPSIGLHARDTRRLIGTLHGLRDRGNSVIVVEHDEEMIRAADHVVDLGPGAGRLGGRVVASGSPAEVMGRRRSLTGAYLRGERQIPIPPRRRAPQGWLRVRGARLHNLCDLDVELPLGTLNAVTGVSGSGKSTLVMEVLRHGVKAVLGGTTEGSDRCRGLEGLRQVREQVVIDSSPIGTTPASNPATYTKVFDPIREVFAAQPEARVRGFTRTRFSFNQGDGRCTACQGRGAVLVEMHFLSDLWVPCEACRGRRYDRETLSVTWQGHSIGDVLDLEVDEARELFARHPRIRRKLDVLAEVGLGYVKLGQSSTTLSGGEAQRVKLAAELSRTSSGRTLYLLDEPTTGLHFADVERLVAVLHRLVDRGNTVVVIEHQLDVVANADWVVDLGPEGGDAGGRLVAAGTPETVAANADSWTGRSLRELLERRGSSAAGAQLVGGRP